MMQFQYPMKDKEYEDALSVFKLKKISPEGT